MSIYSWNNTAEHSLNRFTNDNFTRDHLTDSNVTSASSTMNSVNGAMQQGMVSELV